MSHSVSWNIKANRKTGCFNPFSAVLTLRSAAPTWLKCSHPKLATLESVYFYSAHGLSVFRPCLNVEDLGTPSILTPTRKRSLSRVRKLVQTPIQVEPNPHPSRPFSSRSQAPVAPPPGATNRARARADVTPELRRQHRPAPPPGDESHGGGVGRGRGRVGERRCGPV